MLHFKTDDSEKDLIEKAAKQGVRVYGLSEYCVKDNEDSTGKAVILLGYANMNEERIRAAVQLLCKACLLYTSETMEQWWFMSF